jgi:6-carboxyhexanoate--CoA ligase
MRASSGQPWAGPHRHLSGAERLVPEYEAMEAGHVLLARAMREGLDADHIHLTFERVPARHIRHVPVLPVTTIDCPSPVAARPPAERVLLKAGVSQGAIDVAFDHVLRGVNGSGGALRGALLVDARNGDPFAAVGHDGVRASHFDYSPGTREMLFGQLEAAGLSHHRTHEALALATKVLAAGVCAELCWSDDATYAAGYVSSLQSGYVRFPKFKPAGAVGGRVFFYDGLPTLIEACIRRLKTESVLIDGPTTVRVVSGAEEFLASQPQA